MKRTRKRKQLDGHQVVGLFMILGIIVAFTGFAFERLDVAIMAGVAAVFVYALLGPRRPGPEGDGGIGVYYQSDGGGCGGDGGGD